MREARFLDDIRAKCTVASTNITPYARWANSIAAKTSVATALAEVNHQLSYFYGTFTRFWNSTKSPYYLFLHRTRYQLEKELAYQQRQALLADDEITNQERADMVSFYLKQPIDATYSLTELTKTQFTRLFSPYYDLKYELDITPLGQQLHDIKPLLPESWQLQLIDYLYTWRMIDLPIDVKSSLYNEKALNQYGERISAEIAQGISEKACLVHLQVLSCFNVARFSIKNILRRARHVVELSEHIDLTTAPQNTVDLIQLSRAWLDDQKLNQLIAHAFNIGLTSGTIHGEQYHKSISKGLSSLRVRGNLLGNFAAYIDSLSDEKTFKPSLHAQYQQMLSDTESMFDEVPETPELNPGRFYSLRAGWNHHVVSMVIAQIEGVTYLSFANRGGGAGEEPGLHFYKVNNPEALKSMAVICKFHRNTEDNRDYVLDHATDGSGIGKDLQLEPITYIRQKPQRGARCSAVAFNKDVECRMTFLAIADMAREKKQAGEPTALTKDNFERAHADAKPIYKAFRSYSRLHSADQLEKGLQQLERDLKIPAATLVSFKRSHDTVMNNVCRYADRKEASLFYHSFSLDLPDKLKAIAARRKQQQDLRQLEPNAADQEVLSIRTCG